MKKIVTGIITGITTGILFLAFLVEAMANPVPYKDGSGRGVGSAPAEKLPPHPVIPITAVFGATGRGFPSGRMSLTLDYLYSQADKVRFHGSFIEQQQIYESGQQFSGLTKNLGLLKLRYGIIPGFDIRSETPLYLLSTEDFAGKDRTYHFMGDTTVVVHKVVVSQLRDIGELDFAIDIGITFPTAEVSDESFDFYGTGNWGMIAGAQASWLYGRHRLDGELNYASFKKGRHNYRKPDRARLNLSWGYILGSNVDIGFESNYEWNRDSKRRGKKQHDAFINWFVGPKLACRLPQYGMLLGTALTFPAFRKYDKPMLAEDYRFELKFAKFF